MDTEEKRARDAGWVPKEEWKGSPDKHYGYEEFNRRGDEILPIVNANKRRLEDEVSGLKAEVAKLREGNKQFKEFSDDALRKQAIEHESAISKLENARKQALDDNDGDKFNQADKDLHKLRSTPVSQPAPAPHPEAVSWMERNDWYGSDVGRTERADRLANKIVQLKPELGGTREFYDEVDRALEEDAKFYGNTNRNRQTVENAGSVNLSKKDRTYDSLSEDEQEACQMFIDTIPNFTKEDYLSNYSWDQE